MTKISKEKTYLIKVPVYISELLESSDEIFGGISYPEMINKIKDKIDLFNENSSSIKVERKNKVFVKQVKNIEYFDASFSEDPALLLRITAFNTNYQDGFFEESERLLLTSKSKIGSATNFVLLFPRIYGNNPKSYKCNWIVLLYEDPNKESLDIATTAKLTLSKIIGIQIKNVKMNSVIESLKQRSKAPELNISFSTMEYDTLDETASFPEYLISSKTKTIREYVYKDIPYEEAQKLLSSDSFVSKGVKVIKRLLFGKHEFRVTQQYTETKMEARERLQETIEEIFNERTQISESEMKEKLYDINFILSKFEPILKNYLEAK